MNSRTSLESNTSTLATALILALVAGCGGGSSKPPTQDSFCDQKAKEECQVVARCTTVMSDCVAERKSLCMQFAAAEKVAPRVFTPGNIQRCIDRTHSVYAKTAPITPTEIAEMDDACRYVFQGNVAKAAACTTKYDCAGMVICDKGLCADKVTKKKMELCGNPGEVCEAGSICTMDGAVYRCLAKKGQGDDCSATAPCLETLRCGADGKCAARAAQSEACTSNDDCASTAPYCDPYAGNKCDPGLAFAAGSPSCADYGGTGSSTGAGGTGGGAGGTGGAGGAGGTGGAGGGGAGGGGAGGGGAGGTGSSDADAGVDAVTVEVGV